ncbi:MAG: NADH-quinone oxidoreductase subunit A [Candidatus Dormibacteraeota bacterium]|nr:NADH-quinone oxidoreductase subunit A [Candidatus Dormibacteraeota bacterium]
MLSDYAPLVIYAVIVVGVVGLLITLSNLLGPQKPYKSKLLPYESGIVPVDPARKRYSVRFYLTAMLFIIFDVEAVFFYPWAVVLRQLRWYGVIEMLVFIGILLVALVHIWRKGGLEWE